MPSGESIEDPGAAATYPKNSPASVPMTIACALNFSSV
jgi:hypothetical protein